MTRPPVRLLESADVSPAERALLEAGQSVAPVHYDVAAGAAKFQASLQGVATASSTGVATSSTVAAVKTATLTKLAVILVPTLGALATYYALRAEPQPVDRPVARPVADAAVVEIEPSVAPVLVGTPSLPPARAEVRAPVQVETRTQSPRRSRPEPARGAPTRAAVIEPAHEVTAHEVTAHEVEAAQPEPTPALREEPKPEPGPATDSINELRGIASARGLIERDPSAALSILRRLSLAHPNGYFIEERAALMVLALAGQGDEDTARKQAATFLKRYPTSPFADRIRAAIR